MYRVPSFCGSFAFAFELVKSIVLFPFPFPELCCSYRVFCTSASSTKSQFQPRRSRRLDRRTDFIRVPFRVEIIGVPKVLGEVGRPFVHVDEFYEFGVEMGIAE